MKIVWISHTGGLGGGAERCLLEGINGIAARGHQMHAVLPWRGELGDVLESMNVSVSVIPYTWWIGTNLSIPVRVRRLVHNMRVGWKGFVDILREVNPDLVVTNTLAVPFGAFAARRLGLTHVWQIHEFGREDHTLAFDFGDLLSLFLINKLSAKVIVSSEALRTKFQPRMSRDKIRLAYYGIEVPPQPPTPKREDGALRLVLVGRLSPEKRQEDAIRAVSLVAQKGLDVRLTLVGHEVDPYGAYLHELVRELGVEARVEFAAFTQNPFPYVASSDAALMCSRCEAFGRVTIEAMALGKPVIGARSGATAELIREGFNGYLYSVSDSKSLAARIEAAYHDRAGLKQMGENAREWAAQTFSLENYTSSLLNIFGEAIECGPGARGKHPGRKDLRDPAIEGTSTPVIKN